MRLASESPYPGERDNASAAARRLAESHGMSLAEAARAGIRSESPPRHQPDRDPGADNGVGRRRPRRTYWDQDDGATMGRSKAEWLSEYARMRREMRKDMDSQDRTQALWLAFLIGAIFSVVGGVAFVVNEVADFLRLALTGS